MENNPLRVILLHFGCAFTLVLHQPSYILYLWSNPTTWVLRSSPTVSAPSGLTPLQSGGMTGMSWIGEKLCLQWVMRRFTRLRGRRWWRWQEEMFMEEEIELISSATPTLKPLLPGVIYSVFHLPLISLPLSLVWWTDLKRNMKKVHMKVKMTRTKCMDIQTGICKSLC